MSENAPDPRRRLSSAEITAAELDDWRLLAGGLHARFAPAEYSTGLDFVAQVGAAAQEADHHPDTTLTYGDVVFALSSHDVGGVTSRDLRLARRISAIAQGLGIPARPGGLSRIEIGLDTAHGEQHARYYATLLGADVTGDGEVADSSGQAPTLWWQGPAPAGSAGTTALPAPEVEQRWHLDVWVAPEEAEPRLQAVLDAGGRLVSDAAAPSFWVVEDVDGNRSCICTSQGRA